MYHITSCGFIFMFDHFLIFSVALGGEVVGVVVIVGVVVVLTVVIVVVVVIVVRCWQHTESCLRLQSTFLILQMNGIWQRDCAGRSNSSKYRGRWGLE